ncbi:MAG TPA: TIM-barrel domain-containing protein [Terriglobia bacterium]|nr:TIM-barrel domain-containing protein [Terriglobia bacterium]
MGSRISRRKVLAGLATTGAGALLGAHRAKGSQAAPESGGSSPIIVAGQPVELTLTQVTPRTLRVMLVPVLPDGTAKPIENDLVLVRQTWPAAAKLRSKSQNQAIPWGSRTASLQFDPLQVEVRDQRRKLIQRLQVDSGTGAVTFACGEGPIFGLGEGNHQFERRGAVYPMDHGQGGPQFPILGGRMAVPWLASPEGWAIFWHRPLGTFDLTGKDGRFEPRDAAARLPIDIFVVAGDPVEIYAELAALTGFPHMPPIWALGYQQSHRTLASREEILSEAKMFRDKKLPCDVLIYLGTGFCPSGWNTGHGSFTFNEHVFPDPARMIEEMHGEGFKVAVHVVPKVRDLHGSVKDTGAAAEDPQDAAHYWQEHVTDFHLGLDGWWPDEGDWLTERACLLRNRMYWEGCQKERPNVRPYALHRNGYAGMQRYGWLWSGDIDSTWEALATQVSVGINTGLSGMPFWGTDTGGFVTTPELTGELYARWFQFSTFCPLFRSHGRTWKLRLPWGWSTGDYGPTEITGYHGKAGLPDPKELHNAQVEPVCRKYLELRYRLMPYTYTVVREAHDSGLPIMRALWLHYPDDPRATERGDEYLWGRDILVAPVTEKGAVSRKLYLPRGEWYDFWTEEKLEGGREVDRPVDLATMPIYTRAGTVLPMGPVRQYSAEKVPGPLTFSVYPGSDGEFVMYEDDGVSFNYDGGEFMRLRARWDGHQKRLTLDLAEGSRMLGPSPRPMELRIAGSGVKRQITFDGRTQIVRL